MFDLASNETVVEVVQELDNLQDRLTDLSVQVLREALEAGETKRPDVDKKLSQAVRAIEKASRALKA